MKISGVVALSVLVLLSASLATAKGVDKTNAKRIVGTEDAVRVDAEIIPSAAGSVARVIFEVQNLSDQAIAIADLSANTDYDSSSHTVTVNLGSEIPPDQPTRLIRIEPNETKTFTKGAPLKGVVAGPDRLLGAQRYVRVKLNFLRNLAPFQMLFGSPTVPAADLFPVWVDSNDTVITNSVPIDVQSAPLDSRLSAENAGY